jgi:hypothetical protein
MGAENRLRPRASDTGSSEQARNARLTYTKNNRNFELVPRKSEVFCQSLIREEVKSSIGHGYDSR